jgi:hypothetical protein
MHCKFQWGKGVLGEGAHANHVTSKSTPDRVYNLTKRVSFTI